MAEQTTLDIDRFPAQHSWVHRSSKNSHGCWISNSYTPACLVLLRVKRQQSMPTDVPTAFLALVQQSSKSVHSLWLSRLPQHSWAEVSSLCAETPAAHAPLKSPYQNGCAGIKERHNPHLSAHYRCVDHVQSKAANQALWCPLSLLSTMLKPIKHICRALQELQRLSIGGWNLSEFRLQRLLHGNVEHPFWIDVRERERSWGRTNHVQQKKIVVTRQGWGWYRYLHAKSIKKQAYQQNLKSIHLEK